MSENTVRSRDPEIRTYSDRLERTSTTRLPVPQLVQELHTLRNEYNALNPEQRRTLRYNTAENMRRSANTRGDHRTLYFLDHGFLPPAGCGIPARNIDTGNFATQEQNNALSLAANRAGARR